MSIRKVRLVSGRPLFSTEVLPVKLLAYIATLAAVAVVSVHIVLIPPM
jgi:hypothetical protein